MEALEQLQSGISQAASAASPALVGVGGRWTAGSGVIAGPGRILTNAHNLRGSQAAITFSDGLTTTARVAGSDIDGDIAVLDADTGDRPAIRWAGGEIEVGMPVVALANPGGRGLRVTLGFVSGTERSFRGPRGRLVAGAVEHTAPLLPGSSGGPVVDLSGRLLGINTNRLGDGFYLALPADDDLKRRVDSLGRGEEPRRVRLGVSLAPAHVARRLRRAVGLQEIDGLLVRGVEDDGPAAAVGVREGDLIVEADGRAIEDFDALVNAVESAQGSLRLKLVRGTDELEVEVGLQEG
ncbi:MAG TPA: S1C family serine protease [Actinomycetota bacterium]|nr:S1C family serine protease [Actinomycetota bacterium]